MAPKWSKLTQAELRELLGFLNLSADGKKAELVHRLSAHLQQLATATAGGTAAGPEGAAAAAAAAEAPVAAQLSQRPWAARVRQKRRS